MTERDLGNSFSWWIGEVVDVHDPDQSGRVRVRVYGRHDDKTNIKDEDLPWALPLQPITSAALGKAGTAPLGLAKGSKVKGYWADKDQQYPIILGSFGKAGDIKNSSTTTGGTEEIDINTGSIPAAATNQSDPVDINPFSKLFKDRITIDDVNKGLKTIDKLARNVGVVNKTAVDDKLKKPTVPTTASHDKTSKTDVLDIIKKVDPDNKGASLKNMVNSYSSVRNIMNATSITSQIGMLSGGISGALGILSGNLNLKNILPVLELTAASGLLPPAASRALYGSLSAVTVASYTNSIHTLNPISTIIPQIDPLGAVPSIILSTVPDTYAQQYYDIDQEPYPGYIEWKDNTTGLIIHTLRGSEPHYASAQDHISAQSAIQLGSVLGTLFKGGTPSIPALAGALTGGLNLVQGLGIASALGKGFNLGSIMGLASHFLPEIGGNIQKVLKNTNKTVLDENLVGGALNNFTKNQALLAIKKQSMKAALNVDQEADYLKTKQITAGLDALGASKLADLPIGSSITLSTELPDGTLLAKTFSK